MTVHAARAAESLAAIRTRVRKLARVLPHVDVQPVLMNEPEEKNCVIITSPFVEKMSNKCLTKRNSVDTGKAWCPCAS